MWEKKEEKEAVWIEFLKNKFHVNGKQLKENKILKNIVVDKTSGKIRKTKQEKRKSTEPDFVENRESIGQGVGKRMRIDSCLYSTSQNDLRECDDEKTRMLNSPGMSDEEKVWWDCA